MPNRSSSPISFLKQQYKEHKGTLYYWDDDKQKGKTLYDDTLVADFERIIGNEDDTILRIKVYRTPLMDWQEKYGILFHAFVLIETEDAYYTLEVSEKCITLQRSTTKEKIRDRYPKGSLRRTLGVRKPERIASANGRRTMTDVVEYIYKEDVLNRNYKVFSTEPHNCQTFAAEIFKNFSD